MMKSKNEIMSEAMREVARPFARKLIAMTEDLDTLDQVLSMLPDDFSETIVAEIINVLHVSRRARTFECVVHDEFAYVKPRVQCKLEKERYKRHPRVYLRGEWCIAGDIHTALRACDDLRNMENAVHGRRGCSPCTTYKMIVT